MQSEIPLLNLDGFLANKPGALKEIASELKYAAENVGFYFIQNHGVSQELVDATFDASRRFHNLPDEEKFAVFYQKENRLIAVDAINSPKEFMVGKKLIATQTHISFEKIQNEYVALTKIVEKL